MPRHKKHSNSTMPRQKERNNRYASRAQDDYTYFSSPMPATHKERINGPDDDFKTYDGVDGMDQAMYTESAEDDVVDSIEGDYHVHTGNEPGQLEESVDGMDDYDSECCGDHNHDNKHVVHLYNKDGNKICHEEEDGMDAWLRGLSQEDRENQVATMVRAMNHLAADMIGEVAALKEKAEKLRKKAKKLDRKALVQYDRAMEIYDLGREIHDRALRGERTSVVEQASIENQTSDDGSEFEQAEDEQSVMSDVVMEAPLFLSRDPLSPPIEQEVKREQSATPSIESTVELIQTLSSTRSASSEASVPSSGTLSASSTVERDSAASVQPNGRSILGQLANLTPEQRQRMKEELMGAMDGIVGALIEYVDSTKASRREAMSNHLP